MRKLHLCIRPLNLLPPPGHPRLSLPLVLLLPLFLAPHPLSSTCLLLTFLPPLLLHPGPVYLLLLPSLESTGGHDRSLDGLYGFVYRGLLFLLLILACLAELLQALLPPSLSALSPVTKAFVLLQRWRAGRLQAAVVPEDGKKSYDGLSTVN